MPHPLRLLAEDSDDLAIIAAAVQDGIAKVGDIKFDQHARTLTIGFNRYRWEKKGGERVRAGLQISSVLSVATRNLRQGAKDAVVDLLTIAFDHGEAPAGVMTFTFAGGGDLRCEVECIDVILADVSLAWPSQREPQHDA